MRPRHRVLVVGLLVLVAGALVLWRPHSAPSRAPGLSVLLISIDTLRFDALGSYGKAQAGTPWMDRLAEEGVRFERAYAHNVVTLPSHANMLSGLYPHEHGVRDNAGFRFPRTLPTLATLLKQAGYRTGAFVSAFPLDSRFGLDAGFDVYDDAFLNVDAVAGHQVQQRPGPQTVARARQWLEGGVTAPSFCFVHLYEPHFPYAPYQADVAAADRALEPLLRPLLEQKGAGRTLVVLTSDHGEGLGEHGEATHGIFAYEATLRVPLILFAPRLLGSRVVGGVARHVDLLPTILDALALPVPSPVRGASLLAAAQVGEAPAASSYFEALTGAFSRGWAPLYGMLDGTRKYIELPEPELYDVASDPGERRNLVATSDVSRLRELLAAERVRDSGGRRVRESGEVRERLLALGYVASGVPGKAASRDDDPKRLIALDATLQRATTAEVEGRLAEAVALVRQVLAEQPKMAVAHIQLARLLRSAGDQSAALSALRQALALRPGDPVAAALLGAYLNEAGRPKETIALLEPLAAAPDPDVDVLVALGIALADSGRREQAKQAFESARRADPSDAMLAVNLATVHMLAGGSEDAPAAELLQQATAQRPDLFRAWNALGVIAARGGRPEEAISHWRTALSLDPNAFDTLYNLGSALWLRGLREEARALLQRFVLRAPRQQYAQDIARAQAWLSAPASPR